ncbi:MAG: hypothetical protein WC197_05435 [Candidatus Gastranaerophilaceae bacterium]|jgi:hypothetical protein
MEKLEKMTNAKNLIMEVEQECIDQIGYSPYELGYALRSLEDAIELVKKLTRED